MVALSGQRAHAGLGTVLLPPGENVPLAQALHVLPPKPAVQTAITGCIGEEVCLDSCGEHGAVFQSVLPKICACYVYFL